MISSDLPDKLLDESSSWEPLIPFLDDDLPIFPIHVLPPWLRHWVVAESESTQTPPDLSAMLVLAVIALGAAKKIVVRVKDDWHEPVNLYVVVSLPSGEGKSPVFRHAMAPVREYEKQLQEAAAPKIAEAKERLELAEKHRDECRRIATKEKRDQSKRQRAEDEALEWASEIECKLRVPPIPRLSTNDCTSQSLAELLSTQGGRIGVLSAEGGPFDLMAGKFNSGAPDFEIYLCGYSGDTYISDRITREGGRVDAPAITVAVTTQPEIVEGLAAKQGFRGRGLLARFLFVRPKSLVGARKVDTPAVPAGIRREYERHMLEILGLLPPEDSTVEIEARAIQLSPEAHGARVEFRSSIEPRLGPGGDLEEIQDWGNKLGGVVIRLAGLLHIADHAGGGGAEVLNPISEDTLKRAISIARYMVSHAVAAFMSMGGNEAIEDARYVLGRVQGDMRESGQATITKRAVFRLTHGRFTTAGDLMPPLEVLVSRNYMREVPSHEDPKAMSRRVLYEVNPAISEAPNTVTTVTTGERHPSERQVVTVVTPNGGPENAFFDEEPAESPSSEAATPPSSAGEELQDEPQACDAGPVPDECIGHIRQHRFGPRPPKA